MVNNAISLVYPSNDLPLHATSDQKLKVVYRGNDLGDEYAISFKKIVQGEELKEDIKLKDKYLWTPLKVKDGNGDETWVKILKSDLKQTFQIGDDELLEVKDIQGLESLIGVHLNKIFDDLDDESQISENNSLYRSIVKFFLCHFVVYPTAKRTVLKEIENKTPEQLADIYVKDKETLLATVTGRLQKKHESALEFFGSEMISQIIDEALITEANKQLKKQKQAPWDENKLLKLNELRVVEFFRKNPDEINNDEELKKINIFEIPISKLATIPATKTNLETLTVIWNLVKGDLHDKGSLSELKHTTDKRENTLKAHYASMYLDASYSMPKEIRELLFEKNKVEKITQFALQESAIGKGALQEQQRVYSEKIQPMIEVELEKYTGSNSASDLLNLYTEVYGKREIIKEKILSELNLDEKNLFNDIKIESLILKEIEKTLVLKYNITSTQFNNLVEYRDAYIEKIEQNESFIEKMKNAKSEGEVFELIGLDSKKEKLPSAFPKPVGYPLSPLINLDRKLVVEQLIEADKQLKNLQEDPSKLINKDLKLKLDEEIKKGEQYLSEMIDNEIINSEYNEDFKSGNEYIDKMLYNEQIEKEISNGQNSSLFSPEQQLNLMKLELLFNQGKLSLINKTRLIDDNKQVFSEVTRKLVLEFLGNVKNDPQLIKSLESCRPSFNPSAFQSNDLSETKKTINKLPVGISEDTIKFVLEYVLRTEKMEKLAKPFDKALFKAEHLLKRYEKDPTSISKDERLSLKELGVLSAVNRLSTQRYRNKKMENFDFSQELKILGFEGLGWKVSDFNKNLETAKMYLKQFDEISQKAINEHYEAGDLFAYNGIKKEKWQDKPSDTRQKLTMFVADNVTHGGKLYRENGKIKTHHLLGTVVSQEFNFYEICVSDVWKLDLKPLTPKSMEGYLAEILGDKWGDEINIMHRSIENDLQSNSANKFANVMNNENRMNLAGIANYGSLLKFFNKELQGHERDFDRDFNKLYDKFFNDEKLEEKQICSEFASKITLVSIMKVNRDLSEKLLDKLGDTFDLKKIAEQMKNNNNEISQEMKDYADGVRHYRKKTTSDNAKDNWKFTLNAEKAWRELLKEEGRTSSDIDVIMRLANKEVLDLPYSKKERLRAIHPGRMASLLVEKGCATKRELPPEMQTLFDI